MSFTFTSGADSLVGATDGADTFAGTIANITAADTVIAGPGAGDVLSLTGGGTLAAASLANIDGIETIQLNGSTAYSLTLPAGALGSESGTLTVNTGGGADTVSAASFGATERLSFVAATGIGDRVTGGAGADLFNLSATGNVFVSGGAGDDTVIIRVSTLNNLDTLAGGDGTDRLELSNAGSLAATAFANVSGFE